MTYWEAIEGKKTLFLVLHRKWWDMIHEGIKKEEYRDITDYYRRRLVKKFDFDVVIFVNGYAKDRPTMVVEVAKQPYIGVGRPEWGAEAEKEYYTIGLGRVLWSSKIKAGLI